MKNIRFYTIAVLFDRKKKKKKIYSSIKSTQYKM